MTVQLRLPGHWPRNMSRRDPIAALEEIQRDKFEATYAIELLLDRLAEKHGIGHKVIAKAVEGYVSDMLGDVFFDLKDERRTERDEARMRSVGMAIARRRIEIGRYGAVSDGTSAEHRVGFGGDTVPAVIGFRAEPRPSWLVPQPSQAPRHDTSPYWARARQWLCPWVGAYRRH